MARFLYQAYDSSGGKLQGEIEASDVTKAKQQIAEQQLMLVEIKEDGDTVAGLDIFQRNKVSIQELSLIHI